MVTTRSRTTSEALTPTRALHAGDEVQSAPTTRRRGAAATTDSPRASPKVRKGASASPRASPRKAAAGKRATRGSRLRNALVDEEEGLEGVKEETESEAGTDAGATEESAEDAKDETDGADTESVVSAAESAATDDTARPDDIKIEADEESASEAGEEDESEAPSDAETDATPVPEHEHEHESSEDEDEGTPKPATPPVETPKKRKSLAPEASVKKARTSLAATPAKTPAKTPVKTPAKTPKTKTPAKKTPAQANGARNTSTARRRQRQKERRAVLASHPAVALSSVPSATAAKLREAIGTVLGREEGSVCASRFARAVDEEWEALVPATRAVVLDEVAKGRVKVVVGGEKGALRVERGEAFW